jgi:hypothetical protein
MHGHGLPWNGMEESARITTIQSENAACDRATSFGNSFLVEVMATRRPDDWHGMACEGENSTCQH